MPRHPLSLPFEVSGSNPPRVVDYGAAFGAMTFPSPFSRHCFWLAAASALWPSCPVLSHLSHAMPVVGGLSFRPSWPLLEVCPAACPAHDSHHRRLLPPLSAWSSVTSCLLGFHSVHGFRSFRAFWAFTQRIVCSHFVPLLPPLSAWLLVTLCLLGFSLCA